MTETRALIRQGELAKARQDLVARVKARPADAALRFEFAELLLVLGEWDRADQQFDIVSTQDPSFGVVVALIRQLIRGESARRQVFAEGRMPELIGEAGAPAVGGLDLLVELRRGADGRALRARLDDAAPVVRGVCNKTPFVGWRDLDDRTADVLEVITATGKYFWIGFDQVRSLQVKPAERLRDLVWRAAELDVREGPNGTVYLPVTYVCEEAQAADEVRLARRSDWIERQGVVLGLGQRCWLLGEEVLALDDIGLVELSDE